MVDPYKNLKNKSAQKNLKLKFCYDYACISITYLNLGPPLLVKKETLFSKPTILLPEVGGTNFWVLESESEIMPKPKRIRYWIRDSENDRNETKSETETKKKP